MRYLLKEYREKRRDDGKQSKRIEICQNQERLSKRAITTPTIEKDSLMSMT